MEPHEDRKKWTVADWNRYYSLTAEAHHGVVAEFQSVQAEAIASLEAQSAEAHVHRGFPSTWMRVGIPLAVATALVWGVVSVWPASHVELFVHVNGEQVYGKSSPAWQPGLLVLLRAEKGNPEVLAVVEAVSADTPQLRLLADEARDGTYDVELVALSDLPPGAIVTSLAGREEGMEVLGLVPEGTASPGLLTEYVVTRERGEPAVARRGRTGIAWSSREDHDGGTHPDRARWLGYLPKTNIGGAGVQVYTVSAVSNDSFQEMEGTLWDALDGESETTFDAVSDVIQLFVASHHDPEPESDPTVAPASWAEILGSTQIIQWIDDADARARVHPGRLWCYESSSRIGPERIVCFDRHESCLQASRANPRVRGGGVCYVSDTDAGDSTGVRSDCTVIKTPDLTPEIGRFGVSVDWRERDCHFQEVECRLRNESEGWVAALLASESVAVTRAHLRIPEAAGGTKMYAAVTGKYPYVVPAGSTLTVTVVQAACREELDTGVRSLLSDSQGTEVRELYLPSPP